MAADLRAGGGILHFQRAAAVLVRPVQICRRVGDGGPDLKEIALYGVCQTLGGIGGGAGGGKIGYQNLAHVFCSFS